MNEFIKCEPACKKYKSHFFCALRTRARKQDMTSTSTSAPPNETIEKEFVDPFIETVVSADGKKFARLIDTHRDRVLDFLEGRASCIITDSGKPLGLERQQAFMRQLEKIVERLARRSERPADAPEMHEPDSMLDKYYGT